MSSVSVLCMWGGHNCCDMCGKNLCLKPDRQESESPCAAIMQELENRAGWWVEVWAEQTTEESPSS